MKEARGIPLPLQEIYAGHPLPLHEGCAGHPLASSLLLLRAVQIKNGLCDS